MNWKNLQNFALSFAGGTLLPALWCYNPPLWLTGFALIFAGFCTSMSKGE